MEDNIIKKSVAMCTYNGQDFLTLQLDSILNQTFTVDEIIICDDHSTDSTLEILNSYQKKFPHLFKIYINENRLGSVKNFEKAISLCSGEIIFLCDQDDIWKTDKVEQITNVFFNHKDISVVCTNGSGIDEKGEVLDLICVWDAVAMVRKNKFVFDYFNILNLIDNFTTGATMAIRKDIKKYIFPFPIVEGLHHDKWISLVGTSQRKFLFLDKKLIYYRRHPNQQVGNVFYNHSDKEMITNYFSVEREEKSFSEYKRLLKLFYLAYKKNLLLRSELPQQKKYFDTNLNELKRRFENYKKEMTNRYPIKSKILSITDFILSKRQINSLK